MPTIHPSCAIAQARERTPEPIIAVIICALAVHLVPALILHNSVSMASDLCNCVL